MWFSLVLMVAIAMGLVAGLGCLISLVVLTQWKCPQCGKQFFAAFLYSIESAKEMAAGLDGLCLSLVANNRTNLDLPIGDGKSALNEMHFAIRHLVSIGAIHIAEFDGVLRYDWTYIGRRMIEYIDRTNPNIFRVLCGQPPISPE